MSNRDSLQQLDMFFPTASISQAEIDRAVRLARLIQAVTLAGVIVKAGSLVVRGVRKVAAVMAVRYEKARMRAELRSLSDRELADIGMSRCDIDAIVAGVDPLAERRALVAGLVDHTEAEAVLPLVLPVAEKPHAGNDSHPMAA